MALKSREVIGGGLLLLLAWALTLRWLPSLHLVSFAFVAGIAFAATSGVYVVFVTAKPAHSSRQRRFPPASSLGFSSRASWSSEVAASKRRRRYHPQSVFAFLPQLSQSVNQLLDYISRDFLRSWYSKISPGSAFPNEVDRAIRIALRGLTDHLLRQDLVRVSVIHVVPILIAHLKHVSDAERAVRSRNLTGGMTESAELDLAVAAKYCNGNVHPAASLGASKTRGPQNKHLRRLVEAIVPLVLPDNMTTSPAVLVLVNEIVACAVLQPVMQLISDPDTVNQLVEAYGRSVLHDRKTVRKLRAALDEHATVKQPRPAVPSLRLAANDSERSFERFIRTIRQCGNLADARRYSSELARQLQRETSLPTPNTTYVRRLELGKKLLDQKLPQLSHQALTRSASASRLVESSQGPGSHRDAATLREVLYDASGLSYFMEYMDRQKLMTWVQFWIVVDGFRNPLEQDGEESIATARQWTESEQQDLSRISEAYLDRPELKIAHDAQHAVKSFLRAGSGATPTQFAAAQGAVFRAQSAVLQEMEKYHFPRFKSSDLFFRWVASGKDSSARTTSVLLESPAVEHAARAPAIARLQSDVGIRNAAKPDLRRAPGSSPDLARDVQGLEGPARRSLDEHGARFPLFDDDVDEEPMANSIQSLDSVGSDVTKNGAAVDAVQAALDDLVDETPDKEGLFFDRHGLFGDADSDRGSIDVQRTESQAIPQVHDRNKPSLSSLGLIGTPSRRTVFSEGDLFGESEQLWEEDASGAGNNAEDGEDEIREAAPGDLGLAELVQALTLEIDKLEAQQAIVDSLTSKAELTNNSAELRILRKSKTSLSREIRRKELQRQQYIIQESDNTLYGRATISIKNVMVGSEPDGHEFALYVIEVHRGGSEKSPGASWAITRRYSEFYELFKRLRHRFPDLREMEFPRRQVVLTLQKDFLKKRRVALEKFLGELLTWPAVCKSIEFRAFLSQQAIRAPDSADEPEIDRQDFVSRIYNSVTDGMEEFLGNVPVLDQLSLAGQNLISAATSATTGTTQAKQMLGTTALANSVAEDPRSLAEAQAELKAFEASSASSPAQQQATTFITPLADAFIELFQLHTGNAWLRGRAVVVVLQQLLGGTVERKVRDAYRTATTEAALAGYVGLLCDAMWPGGQLRGTPPVRTEQEKAKSRREAAAVLATLLPDLAGGVVGRSNATAAGKRLAAAMNNERLNAHLVYTVLDEVVEQVFGVRAGR